nr:hypothetical protein [Vibrio neptunius]
MIYWNLAPVRSIPSENTRIGCLITPTNPQTPIPLSSRIIPESMMRATWSLGQWRAPQGKVNPMLWYVGGGLGLLALALIVVLALKK